MNKILENTAGGIAGAALGLLTQGMQDKRQLKQQEKLQNLQITGAKTMTDYQHDKQYDMWKKTGFVGQVKEAKEAGLNPALLYGMGGGGGTTAGAGASTVTGATAGDPNAGSMGMIQGAMMKAQIDNLNANTEKTKAEAEKTAGVDTEMKGVEIDIAKINKELGNLDLKVKSETYEDAVKTIRFGVQKLVNENRVIFNQSIVAESTQQIEIDKIKQSLLNMQIEATAKKQQIQLDKARINEISEKLLQGWKSLELEKSGQEISERNMKALTEAMLWGAGISAVGNVVGDFVGLGKDLMKKPLNKTTKTIDKDGGIEIKSENYWKPKK